MSIKRVDLTNGDSKKQRYSSIFTTKLVINLREGKRSENSAQNTGRKKCICSGLENAVEKKVFLQLHTPSASSITDKGLMEREYHPVPAGTKQPDDLFSNIDGTGKGSVGSHHHLTGTHQGCPGYLLRYGGSG